ncbi:tetraacyldisaccharide 4'-kinase [Reinekea blandensis]|uniref:Tetraacyldisaccharide 4'-kinase n=1 Tax=Reinekea blandensis MED297 TaxID=314283 RepID=A4BE07_9GAMM|nr:tetraacyldisaccharide 4'-kinase [Reinekea blandensis]EAR09766.1 hypothetical protein MED297_16444 [Reinekea blandensis MED297]
MKFWYRQRISFLALLLLPLSALVWCVSRYRYRHRNQNTYPIPVVVVGNLTVGGTGKTPTIIWLINTLQRHHYKVAVVSRGYRAKPTRSYPVLADYTDTAETIGDEPALIAQSTQAMVVIDPDRHRAVQFLCDLPAGQRPDVIVSDDGMQHYRMARDIEILMYDTLRGLGNGCLIPAGPLRESSQRLSSVSLVLAKQQGPQLPESAIEVAQEVIALAKNREGVELPRQTVNIHTAIGNAESFQRTAESVGYTVNRTVAYRDHDKLPLEPIQRSDFPVLTTEKDAVKLSSWPDNVYVLPYELKYGPETAHFLLHRIQELIDEKRRHHSRTL